MYKTIQEGKIKLKVPNEQKISKKLPVFYNPGMELNRTISVLLLNNIENKKMQIGLPLAGSGVRGIRFLKELTKGKIKEIQLNDLSNNAIKLIKENLKLNKIKTKIKVNNEDANIFLLNSLGFDYIDIDPFGSPNFLLNNSIVRLSRNGVLAVTATDTGALSGTYPKACARKYWAKPLKNSVMHETGIRILIRKIQLIGAQLDKALVPIFSHSTEHYMRVYFKCEKGKKKVDEIMNKHGTFMNAGPLWLGKLWDAKLVKKMAKNTDNKMLKLIESESKIDVIGFYDIHMFCKKHKLIIPKKEKLIKKLKKLKYEVSETHFNQQSIKSDVKEKELIEIIKKIK